MEFFPNPAMKAMVQVA